MPAPAFTLPLAPLTTAEQVEYAARAERLGYGSCWLAELANADSFALGGAIAGRTGLELATGIVSVYSRSPMVLAMGAASLAGLTGGRFKLGLGVSTRTVVSDWHGVPYEAPLARVRQTVAVVRRLLEGESVSFEGDAVRVSRARLEAPPASPPPIYLAALNPRMLRLAGEVADGVILNLLGPEHLPLLIEDVRAGALAAGRDPADVGVAVRLVVLVDHEREEALAKARSHFAPYVAASGYSSFMRRIGFDPEVAAIEAAFGRHSRQEAEAAISDRLAEALVVHGDVAACRGRIAQFEAAGAGTIILSPFADTAQSCWRMLEAFAPTAS